MAEPFERRASPRPGLLSRLFGGGPRASAAARLEDLLARAARIRDVPQSSVDEIAGACGVDLETQLHTPRVNLYRRFLEHCLLDQRVSPEESSELAHLRRILRLSDADAARAHEDVARSVYGRAIAGVLEDQRLDAEEADFLRKLRGELDLPEDVAESLYAEGREQARRRFLERNIARDDFLVTSRDVVLELTGQSETSVEDAVRKTVDEACRAVDGLHFVELTQIGAELREGGVSRWHVKLRAKRESGE